MMRQKIPSDRYKREYLRTRGQFWTPPWVAEPMVKYVASKQRKKSVFDPAVGSGAFLHAAIATCREIEISGFDLYDDVVPDELKPHVDTGDFLTAHVQTQQGIVCNPPYIRHHRIPKEYKRRINYECSSVIGANIDQRAGLHVYFLIKALSLLKPRGRLAFIVPADVCEGKFSKHLWGWIGSNFRLEHAIMFVDGASPFEADVNSMIFMISNSKPASTFNHAVCRHVGTDDLARYVSGIEYDKEAIRVKIRNTGEAITQGLSRHGRPTRGIRLGDFANVVRGIATGANSFFHLTSETAKNHRILDFTVSAVNRTRDVPDDMITNKTIRRMDSEGKPTRLLYVSEDAQDPNLTAYISCAEKDGLHRRPLNKARRMWYVVERRRVPAMLFTYLGRRNNRFILNKANVIPLNTFHCIYVKRGTNVIRLFNALNDKRTIWNLPYVAKSYGFGALKVEPRALEELIIPYQVLEDNNIGIPAGDQIPLDPHSYS